ncbi:CLUMA_CG017870, isoform A [Clunio marinus]|uniref:CLUMA_CG017870, isoform A n=1 Tax=Clunio marinus TaxID=568069 RepID=A0A1J1J1T0_9DIPT|nr:CLUMA_CG017870, isoform A [Clunio marinus]
MFVDDVGEDDDHAGKKQQKKKLKTQNHNDFVRKRTARLRRTSMEFHVFDNRVCLFHLTLFDPQKKKKCRKPSSEAKR